MGDLQKAIEIIRAAGHTITATPDIPGLFYIDNGPELTVWQVIDFARRLSPSLPPRI